MIRNVGTNSSRTDGRRARHAIAPGASSRLTLSPAQPTTTLVKITARQGSQPEKEYFSVVTNRSPIASVR